MTRDEELIAAGRAAFEAFTAAMTNWIKDPPDWNGLSPHVREGWIAAARAAREK